MDPCFKNPLEIVDHPGIFGFSFQHTVFWDKFILILDILRVNRKYGFLDIQNVECCGSHSKFRFEHIQLVNALEQ